MLLFRGKKGKGQSQPTKAERRLAKDVHDLSYDRLTAPKTVTKINFPNGSAELTHFTCTICPQEGVYAGGNFVFDINVPSSYPFAPPEIKCITKVYHPNFHWQTGEVRIGLLTRDWKPVLSINNMIFQLQLLFIEPGSDLEHANNEECRNMIHENYAKFEAFVRETLGGGMFFGERWEPNCTQAEKLRGNKRTRGKEIIRGKRRKHTLVESDESDVEHRVGKKKTIRHGGSFLPPFGEGLQFLQRPAISYGSSSSSSCAPIQPLSNSINTRQRPSSQMPFSTLENRKTKRICPENRMRDTEMETGSTHFSITSTIAKPFSSLDDKFSSSSSSSSSAVQPRTFSEEKRSAPSSSSTGFCSSPPGGFSGSFKALSSSDSISKSLYSTVETTTLNSFVKKKRFDKDANMGPNEPQFMSSKERAEERAKICTVSHHSEYTNGTLGAHPFMSPRAILETRKPTNSPKSTRASGPNNRVSGSISSFTARPSLKHFDSASDALSISQRATVSAMGTTASAMGSQKSSVPRKKSSGDSDVMMDEV